MPVKDLQAPSMLRKRNDGIAAHGVFEDLPDE
jgi:hypothetical protein